MEQYLINDYDVFEDIKWLTDESQIENYFTDNYDDLFDCGQGYYQDEANLICKIKDKFYGVTVKADIRSQRQDRGDDIYFVDYINSVEYEEIDKPLPKDREIVTYTISLTKSEKVSLENFMNENSLKYELD